MTSPTPEPDAELGSVPPQTWDRALDAVSDVVLESDAAGRVQWVSASVTHLLGHSPEDLRGLQLEQLVHPDDLAALTAAHEAVRSGADLAPLGVRFRTADLGWRELTLRLHPLLADGTPVGEIATLTDEQEARAVSQAFRTVMAGNEVLVRARSAEELLEQMCDAVVQAGGYAFSWYGVPRDTEGRPVEPVAVGGDDLGYTQQVTVSWDEDSPYGQGPTGVALRTGTTQVRNDLANDPRYGPWREAASDRNVCCSITLPVTVDGRIHGALMVYGRQPGGFGTVARAMLEGLAADLGYGLARLADAQRQLEVEAQFRLIAEHTLDVVLRCGTDGTITWASPSVRDVLGWDADELLGTSFDSLVHPDDAGALPTGPPRQGRPRIGAEVRLLDRERRWRWMRLHRTPLLEGDRAVGRIESLRDVDSEVRTRMQAVYEAHHDPLTGLLNRSGLLDLLESTPATERESATLVAVGVDNLRQINTAYSHTAGDIVLLDVADRLIATVGDRRLIARSGDNEFGILVPKGDTATLTDLAVRLRESCATTIRFGTHSIPVTVSIGIAQGIRGRSGDLVRDASTALGQARAAGGHRWEFLDPRVGAEARARLTVQSGLQDALSSGEIRPWFQPIVGLADEEIRGYEALARWVRADGTVVPPVDFLPAAEQGDLIRAVDRRILADAVGALEALPEAQHVAANLSARTLADPDLVPFVTATLGAHDVRPSRLHLEVTETALLDVTPAVLSAMRTLAERGITWWVDDFGTGYSSLAHLRDLPVHGLKLDRSFTGDVAVEASTHRRLAQGLLGLAHGLGLHTIAEGVETEPQAEALRSQGWECAQGWHYGRPAPLPAT